MKTITAAIVATAAMICADHAQANGQPDRDKEDGERYEDQEDRGGEDHTDKQQHGIDDQFHR